MEEMSHTTQADEETQKIDRQRRKEKINASENKLPKREREVDR